MKRKEPMIRMRLPHLTWGFEANHKILLPKFPRIATDMGRRGSNKVPRLAFGYSTVPKRKSVVTLSNGQQDLLLLSLALHAWCLFRDISCPLCIHLSPWRDQSPPKAGSGPNNHPCSLLVALIYLQVDECVIMQGLVERWTFGRLSLRSADRAYSPPFLAEPRLSFSCLCIWRI